MTNYLYKFLFNLLIPIMCLSIKNNLFTSQIQCQILEYPVSTRILTGYSKMDVNFGDNCLVIIEAL